MPKQIVSRRSRPPAERCGGLLAQSEHSGGFERRAARAGRIAIRHQLDSWDLLFTLNRHAGPHFVDKPVAKRDGGFHGPAADQKTVGVEHVDHLID